MVPTASVSTQAAASSAAQGAIAPSSAVTAGLVIDREPPAHADTTPPLYGRPGYMAGLAGAAFSRYILRSLAKFITEIIGPVTWDHNMVNGRLEKIIDALEEQNGNAIFPNLEHLDNIVELADEYSEQIKEKEARMGALELRDPLLKEEGHRNRLLRRYWPFDRAVADYLQSNSGPGYELNKKLEDIGIRLEDRNNVVKNIWDSETLAPKVNTQTRDRIKRGLSKDRKAELAGLNSGLYDAAAGLGSVFFTTMYRRKVVQDMQKVYSEAVGYELGKPADQVTWNDIKQSNNGAIQETFRELQSRNNWRYGTDAIFFGGLALTGLKKTGLFANAEKWNKYIQTPFQQLTWSDLGIGGKGTLLVSDMWLRKTTTFEKITDIVDKKLKTLNGLGDEITTSDLVDMHQHYAQRNAPELAFTQVLGNQEVEEARWDKAKVFFDRMAELMNLSYNYKHIGSSEESFTLPKFIYLLGHNLIDPNQPERTLAFVEIANAEGIEALKEAKQLFKRGQNIAEVIERFPTAHKKIASSPNTLIPKVLISTEQVTHTPPAITQQHIH